MENNNEQRVDEVNELTTPETVEELVEKAGYPDISKANTKTVVIWSLIVVILVLLLSIFVPTPSSVENATTEQTTAISTQTTEEPATENATKETTEESDPAHQNQRRVR